MVGETSLADLKTRPDYAVTLGNALIGFIEVKASGKGADPRRFHDRHDEGAVGEAPDPPAPHLHGRQRIQPLANGELEGDVVRLEGDVETAGAKLTAPDGLVSLFADFFQWELQPPRSARELADTTARLYRLLRESARTVAMTAPAN